MHTAHLEQAGLLGRSEVGKVLSFFLGVARPWVNNGGPDATETTAFASGPATHGRTSSLFWCTPGKSGTTTSHSNFLGAAAAPVASEEEVAIVLRCVRGEERTMLLLLLLFLLSLLWDGTPGLVAVIRGREGQLRTWNGSALVVERELRRYEAMGWMHSSERLVES